MPEHSRWRALVLLALAELFGMCAWFSAWAVIPSLQAEWNLTAASATWMTLAVQLGFVAGAELASFLVLASGAVGCVVAGIVADRAGRTLVTTVALVTSGLCCLTIGFLFPANPTVLLVVAVIWGSSVIADSAQFSACVTELGEPEYIGSDAANLFRVSAHNAVDRVDSDFGRTGRMAICLWPLVDLAPLHTARSRPPASPAPAAPGISIPATPAHHRCRASHGSIPMRSQFVVKTLA